MLSLGALLLVLDAVRLLWPPIVGLPDNGDFWRVMRPAGIRYLALPSQKFVVPEFALVKPPLRHLSSPALVAVVARGMPIGSARRGFMDLRQVGAANWLLLGAAAALFVGASPEGLVVGLLLIWTLNDPGYLLYFNSFFADAVAFIGALGVVAWLVRQGSSAVSPRQRARLSLAVILFSSLAAFAKESYAPMGMVAAAAVGVAVLRSPSRANRSAWALIFAMAGVAVLAPCYFVWGAGYRSPVDNRHDSVFMGIAVASEDTAATLAALGVPREKSYLKGKSVFDVDEDELRVARKVSFGRIAVRYLHDPHAVRFAIGRVGEVLAMPFTNTAHDYTTVGPHAFPWVRSAPWQFGPFRHLLVRQPWQVWAWFTTGLVWIGAAIARRRAGALVGVVAYLLGLFTTQIAVAVIGDGLRTLNRHLLLARLSLDWCILIVLFSLVRAGFAAFERRSRSD